MKSKQWLVLGFTWIACTLYACEDNSMPSDALKCQCAEGQVCSLGGVCYDHPSCALCGEDEVCVSGECYGKTSMCSICDPHEVCKNEKCYAADDPCLSCGDHQVCSDGRCFDKGDPCVACKSYQVCVGGECYAPHDPCAKCEKTHICKNATCFEPDDPCLACDTTEVCFKDQCVSPDETCDPVCQSTELCVAGTCEPCDVTCGNACCKDGEQCDIVLGTCEPQCEGGIASCDGFCCLPDQVCDPVYGCVYTCTETQTRCDNPYLQISQCCRSGQVCEDYLCKEDCKGGVRCNNVCCAPGDVCEDNTCKIPCENGTRCGEDEGLCCDNATSLCLYGGCIPRGIDCTKSSQCAFDEFCEDSTMTCVNVDIMPTTCQVFPEFETFKALKQWQWPQDLPGGVPVQHPDYIRVIVMPMAANFTDDNNDGVINADDIPDVVFIAYSTKRSPDHQAPSVMRVISGDDGREIASSDPRYWTYPIDAAVADIDNDGHVEILAGTNFNRPSYALGGQDQLEALSVVPDTSSPTGYKLEIKYSIPITNGTKLSFISVADIDSDGTPEILTNQGVASVVDGQFAWREGCANRSMSYLHAADLDNDGTMELVSGSTIYDDHCNVLATGLPGGQIAIADMMPSGEDAAETGELVPETAHTIGGYGGGQFKFAKIFKKQQEDGTYKWSVKESWKAPIPISYERALKAGYDCNANPTQGRCNSGGGTPVVADFNGDGKPDIGVAARYYYIVYSNDGTPNGGKVLWADANTQDYSSAVTGSSVFDFEGDGIAEVVYADETKLRVYSGLGSGKDTNGDGYPEPDIIFEVPNYSATGYEYPIIVDVDNDGSTEIVLSSDLQQGVTMGVTAYEDPGGQWVRTRRIWNQHFYHVTNINEDGSVPIKEIVNWLHPKLNNYRQNTQPGGLFNAPNLVAESLSGSRTTCNLDPKTLQLTAKVANKGSLGIKAGLEVKFYVDNANDTGKPALIQTLKVPTILIPGSDSTISFDWDMTGIIEGTTESVSIDPNPTTHMYNVYYVIDAPTEEKTRGEFVECIETDNTSAIFELKACDATVN